MAAPREDEDARTELELGIEIDPDGRVIFTDLPADLVDLVRDLNPDALIACDLEPEAAPEPKEG